MNLPDSNRSALDSLMRDHEVMGDLQKQGTEILPARFSGWTPAPAPVPVVEDPADPPRPIDLPINYDDHDDDGDDGLLHYTHFSVQIHREHRLALFTAVNIDGGSMHNIRRGRDSWPLLSRCPHSGRVLEGGRDRQCLHPQALRDHLSRQSTR